MLAVLAGSLGAATAVAAAVPPGPLAPNVITFTSRRVKSTWRTSRPSPRARHNPYRVPVLFARHSDCLWSRRPRQRRRRPSFSNCSPPTSPESRIYRLTDDACAEVSADRVNPPQTRCRDTDPTSRSSPLPRLSQAAGERRIEAGATVVRNTIGEGDWVVGVDVQAGTYRTTEAVSGDRYWEINSDANCDKFVANDIVTNGRPTTPAMSGGWSVVPTCTSLWPVRARGLSRRRAVPCSDRFRSGDQLVESSAVSTSYAGVTRSLVRASIRSLVSWPASVKPPGASAARNMPDLPRRHGQRWTMRKRTVSRPN
jgi:hypothetical protein